MERFARGELSYSKVRAITRIAVPENEAELVEMARWATAAQLERLVRVLKEDGPRHRNVRLIALFLLSTGARLNEALRARWGDIDRGNRVWRIPALNSKEPRPYRPPTMDG